MNENSILYVGHSKTIEVLSSKTELQEVLQIAPDWRAIADSLASNSSSQPGLYELFERVGAKSIYKKAESLSDDARAPFQKLVRDFFYQPLLTKMLSSNQNLRRFWSQRRIPVDVQKSQALSMAVEIAQKMDGVLSRHIAQRSEDGFKVLLPAYIQRTVHNAVVDHIREEWEWEKETLQDLNLDPTQEDPRQATADDVKYLPENQIISSEQVTQLNQLRGQLEGMLGNNRYQQEPLQVVDLMFGLGLTPHSKAGNELTMREVCDVLKIQGETQARKIARCQVLLDKGLDMIRQVIREKMPGIAEAWQSEMNVNCASRRELSHQLGLTEGEVERLVSNRQYYTLDQLVDRGVLKANRVPEIEKNGAVAAFVPVDLNSATTRDVIDILGASKEAAQKLVAARPFESFAQILKVIDKPQLDVLMARGAVIKNKAAARPDLNRVDLDTIVAQGVPKPIGTLVLRGRPFATWSELEDYLSCDQPTWNNLRQKFCLGISSD